MTTETSSSQIGQTAASKLLSSASTARYNKIRHIKDKLATMGIAWGGVSVIIAIVLIFFYLLFEIMPMFRPASVEPLESFAAPGKGEVLHLALEEQNKVGFRLGAGLQGEGDALFFSAQDGSVLQRHELELNGSTISAFAQESENSRLFAIGTVAGEVLLARHNYKISYPNGEKTITPKLEYPYGDDLIALSPAPIGMLALRDTEAQMLMVVEANGELYGQRLVKEEDMLTEELLLEPEDLSLPALPASPVNLLIGPDGRWLYAVFEDFIGFYDLRQSAGDWQIVSLSEHGKLSTAGLLLGSISVMAADQNGGVTQLFLVRGEQGPTLEKIRYFESDSDSPVSQIVFEHRRKGFITFAQNGTTSFYYSSAHRRIFEEHLLEKAPDFATVSPRANLLLAEVDGEMLRWQVHNEHPEVSWSALWSKVWYESYQEPDFIWQSSASTNDFEPKHSLMPLSFGTLKAAFYAMLLGAPLAICGAIYTAYFMAPAMRKKVKPLVELMEALPTVILGFLAGLWLAPFMEGQMVGVVTILLVLPVMILLFGFVCSFLPVATQNSIAEGWHAFLLIPYLIFVGWLCLQIGPSIEKAFFNGDMRSWLTLEAGIAFDQRNAFVVGIAMGFAVIPTIFSIAEDAIFSVPKHLSFGSLALGATPWQTLVGVILPTASPGIFSALMIGMGRAVGETMIVLMATGNTPIMDINIFEGMRTLSANIAVEIPEAEVGSTHYRILFLAAFVLFSFTFIVNTAAEVIRQRLRKKYGSL